MFIKNRAIFLLISLYQLLIITSCSRSIIILPATMDAFVTASHPETGYDGKSQPIEGYGYGTKKRLYEGDITYPALYLGVGGMDSIKDAIVLGGFDFTSIDRPIEHATLVFFINYMSSSRKRLCLFVRPLLSEWDESSIKYTDIFKGTEPGAEYTSLINPDDNAAKLIVFDSWGIKEPQEPLLPNRSACRFVRIDVTSIIRKWQKEPGSNHGLLLDPMWMNDYRYITTNDSDELSDFGILEVAAGEWTEWDGNVPASFSGDWLSMKNRAFGTFKYVPHLEITTEQ